MQQSDRERFEALIAAKKNKGGGKTTGHGDDRRGSAAKSANVKQTFKQRKV